MFNFFKNLYLKYKCKQHILCYLDYLGSSYPKGRTINNLSKTLDTPYTLTQDCLKELVIKNKLRKEVVVDNFNTKQVIYTIVR